MPKITGPVSTPLQTPEPDSATAADTSSPSSVGSSSQALPRDTLDHTVAQASASADSRPRATLVAPHDPLARLRSSSDAFNQLFQRLPPNLKNEVKLRFQMSSEKYDNLKGQNPQAAAAALSKGMAKLGASILAGTLSGGLSGVKTALAFDASVDLVTGGANCIAQEQKLESGIQDLKHELKSMAQHFRDQPEVLDSLQDIVQELDERKMSFARHGGFYEWIPNPMESVLDGARALSNYFSPAVSHNESSGTSIAQDAAEPETEVQNETPPGPRELADSFGDALLTHLESHSDNFRAYYQQLPGDSQSELALELNLVHEKYENLHEKDPKAAIARMNKGMAKLTVGILEGTFSGGMSTLSTGLAIDSAMDLFKNGVGIIGQEQTWEQGVQELKHELKSMAGRYGDQPRAMETISEMYDELDGMKDRFARHGGFYEWMPDPLGAMARSFQDMANYFGMGGSKDDES